jgi:hypothetical protein
MDDFEQDVRRAIATFITDIRKAAKRAAIEVILSAFDDKSNPPSDVTATAENRAPSMTGARRRTSTGADTAAVRMRVVAFLREQPGPTTTQLSKALGIHSSKLRRVLRMLADDGAIRIEESSDTLFGGQRRRVYFALENANRVDTDPLSRAAEAA